MSARRKLCTVVLFTFSVLTASGVVPGPIDRSGRSVAQGVVEVPSPNPPFAVRNGPLGLLQRRWLETMFSLPREVPHPLNAANPACLDFTVQGVRLLTGDFGTQGPVIDKTCAVLVQQDLFLSIANIPGTFVAASSSDRYQGYPANPRSAAVFMDAILGVCKNQPFLKIDGVPVDVASYYDVPNPAVFNTPMNYSYMDLAYGGLLGLTVPPSAIAFGGGTYILFRFITPGTYTITYGFTGACILNVTNKTRPFTWVYYDSNNVTQTAEFTDLTHFRNVFPRPSNDTNPDDIQTFGPVSWTMHITVTN